jgi:acyl dehydratase
VPIDPGAVGAATEPSEYAWGSTDCLLYALGVGAGASDPTGFELEFTTENSQDVTQRVLPTFAVIAGSALGSTALFGTFDWTGLVHGGQSFTLHRELPPEGRVRTVTRVAAIYDKGSAAVVVMDSDSVDAGSGDPMFSTQMSLFIRGEGGFGGDRGPSGPKNAPPDREPDHVVTYATREDQALLYRLSGDRNPLHSDPAFAARAGFERPILHGLCTYGTTGRALLHTLCGSDPARFVGMDGRFSKPVYPGESLTVSTWETAPGTSVFVTESSSGATVIDQGIVTYR